MYGDDRRRGEEGGGATASEDAVTPAEEHALAELERQVQRERLTKIRAEEQNRQQQVAREESKHLAAIERQIRDATRKDRELVNKRGRVVTAIVDYLEHVDGRKLALNAAYLELLRLPDGSEARSRRRPGCVSPPWPPSR